MERPTVGDGRTLETLGLRHLTRKAANCEWGWLKPKRELVCALASRDGESGLPFVHALWNPANYIMCPRGWTRYFGICITLLCFPAHVTVLCQVLPFWNKKVFSVTLYVEMMSLSF